MSGLEPLRLLLCIIVERYSEMVNMGAHDNSENSYFTGDLNGEAAMEPDATRPLLGRGACATRGILNTTN